MKLLKEQIKDLVKRCLVQLDPALTELVFEVDYPATEKFGDYTVNAALKAAKFLKGNPMDLAGQLAEKLSADAEAGQLFVKIEAIKPGFINFYLNPVFLSAQVESILKFKGDYGRSDVGRGEKIQ
ncbi:MAG: hypothetical protein Q8P32_04200, partial [Candidatus Komeilibacteria bacterium]|nr:hypothetical protein [Candidatus Komeilibacteria bacterium]